MSVLVVFFTCMFYCSIPTPVPVETGIAGEKEKKDTIEKISFCLVPVLTRFIGTGTFVTGFFSSSCAESFFNFLIKYQYWPGLTVPVHFFQPPFFVISEFFEKSLFLKRRLQATGVSGYGRLHPSDPTRIRLNKRVTETAALTARPQCSV